MCFCGFAGSIRRRGNRHSRATNSHAKSCRLEMGRRGATRTCRANPKRGVAKTLEAGKSGVPQQCRDIILLLYDAYMYGSTEDAKLALQNVHGYDWFPSVFWAASFADRPNELYPQDPGRLGLFLYTKEDRWDGNLRCPPHQSSTAPSLA